MQQYITAFIVWVSIILCGALFNWIELPNSVLLALGYLFAAGAVVVAWKRSGSDGYTFWFCAISAFPLLSPLLIQDILGYEFFSYFARPLQDADGLAEPIILGSLATMFMAVSISPAPVRPTAAEAGLGHLQPKLGKRTAYFVLMGSSGLMLFFAWLAEPGGIVGFVDYRSLVDQRFGGVKFAGGAWALFGVLSLACYVCLRTENSRSVQYIFWLGTIISLAWLFLHARRSETLGLVILLYCVLPKLAIERPQILPRWLKPRIFVMIAVGIIFTLIGYYRTTLDWTALQTPDYLQAPGGAGNNLLTYVAAYYTVKNGGFNLSPGETYWHKLQNLPPEALGLSRAPNTYEFIEEQFNLMGGQYWLMEPVMNFNYFGIAIYALVVVLLANLCIRSFRLFHERQCGIHRYLQASIFLCLIFRTMWYGPNAAINGFIMALLVGGSLEFMLKMSNPLRAEERPWVEGMARERLSQNANRRIGL